MKESWNKKLPGYTEGFSWILKNPIASSEEIVSKSPKFELHLIGSCSGRLNIIDLIVKRNCFICVSKFSCVCKTEKPSGSIRICC